MHAQVRVSSNPVGAGVSPQPPTIDRCITILQLTRDGSQLSPSHLRLVEIMANATSFTITEAIEVAFSNLYAQVVAGTYDYTKQWFWGVENLTRDHEGYILWRGKVIEHYSFCEPNRAERERAAAEALAARCRSLEARGLPINGRTAISSVFAEMPANSPYLPILLVLYTVFRSNGTATCLVVNLPDGRARAMRFDDGTLTHDDFEGAYEAYHGCGFSAAQTDSGGHFAHYADAVAVLESGGFTPELVNPLLN